MSKLSPATAIPSRVVFAGFDDDVEIILFFDVFVTKFLSCLMTSPGLPPFAPQNILFFTVSSKKSSFFGH